MTEMIEPMPAAIDLERLARDLVERTRAAGEFQTDLPPGEFQKFDGRTAD